MISSVPVSLIDSGFKVKEYEIIARNISRMALISQRQRQEILQQAQNELTLEEQESIIRLRDDMADNEEVYALAGLNYAQGPPAGEKLFLSAIADYCLRSRFFNTK